MSAPVQPPLATGSGSPPPKRRARSRSPGRPAPEEVAPEKQEKISRLHEELQFEEERRTEEAHSKKQDGLRRKRELAQMRRKLQSEIRRTASEVKMRETQAAELRRSVAKLEKDEESIIGTKNRRHEQFNQTISKVRSKEVDKKTQLFNKLKETGESRERFLRLESALRNLAQNLPALGNEDPGSAAESRQARMGALEIQAAELRRETADLEQEHALLQEELERAKREVEESAAPLGTGEHHSADAVRVAPAAPIPMLGAEPQPAASRASPVTPVPSERRDMLSRLRPLVDRAGALSSRSSVPSQMLVRPGGSTASATKLRTPPRPISPRLSISPTPRQMSPASRQMSPPPVSQHTGCGQLSASRSATPCQAPSRWPMPNVYMQHSPIFYGDGLFPAATPLPGEAPSPLGNGALCHSARSLTGSARSLPTARRGSITDVIFDQLDKNNDGVVSRSEFRSGMKGQGMRQVLGPGPCFGIAADVPSLSTARF